jgi:two-component system sensor histidine kinase MtrB
VKRPRWRLRAKITLIVALAVMASAVTVSYFAYRSEESAEASQFADRAGTQAYFDQDYLTRLLQTVPASRVTADINLFLEGRGGVATVYVPGVTPKCAVAGPCLDNLPSDVRSAVLSGNTFNGFVQVGGGYGRSYVSVATLSRPHRRPLSLVEVFDDYSYSTVLPQLRRHLIEFNAGGLLLALIVGFAVATGVRRPIRRVGRAARQFGGGDLDVRAKVRGKDELADLAVNFNAMADRLSASLRDLQESQSLQRRFVADVSHELRSPLAAMLAAGDGLDSSDVAARSRSTDLLRGQTRRLAQLVDDLLEMSRFDAGQATLELEPIDLADLSRDAVHTVAPDADIRVTRLGDVHAEVDPRRMHTVIRNLVANAVTHGAPPIDVVVDGRTDPIVITVADDGPGVPADLIDTVFDRFVRADTARGSKGESTGLGLGLARENAMLHGAEITLASTGRTSFSVRLPRSSSRAATGSIPIPR